MPVSERVTSAFHFPVRCRGPRESGSGSVVWPRHRDFGSVVLSTACWQLGILFSVAPQVPFTAIRASQETRVLRSQVWRYLRALSIRNLVFVDGILTMGNSRRAIQE